MAAVAAISTRCQGKTRAGTRCSINVGSDLRDRITGRLACEPLRRGGRHCTFHLQLANFTEEKSSQVADGDTCTIMIDLETTGVDPASANIVELGAVHIETGAAFASVVKPTTCSNAAEHINGISAAELEKAPPFPIAFHRFLSFVGGLLRPLQMETRTHSRRRLGTSPRRGARSPDYGVSPVLVAHNGRRFDFAVLCCECWRHDIDLFTLGRFRYIDSLELISALMPSMDNRFPSGCCKLQCLVGRLEDSFQRCLPFHFECRRTHRALDDARALQHIIETAAGAFGIHASQLTAETGLMSSLDIVATRAALESMGIQRVNSDRPSSQQSLNEEVCLSTCTLADCDTDACSTVLDSSDSESDTSCKSRFQNDFDVAEASSPALPISVDRGRDCSPEPHARPTSPRLLFSFDDCQTFAQEDTTRGVASNSPHRRQQTRNWRQLGAEVCSTGGTQAFPKKGRSSEPLVSSTKMAPPSDREVETPQRGRKRRNMKLGGLFTPEKRICRSREVDTAIACGSLQDSGGLPATKLEGDSIDAD
eukprot:TRINITY_DN50521_c0_g1_i1.p1 TRINITY_DN50521_c0_g1~~TRINITY_DN50521_c0_g1_i1.p1  ORF type:complete len:572 (-),score=54.87 TRINITY_DN50521_c0_g1_i1:109-1719(-)